MRAARAASTSCSSVASGRAKRRFSAIDACSRYGSCETTPTVSDSVASDRSRTSTPSIEIEPVSTSYRRASR